MLIEEGTQVFENNIRNAVAKYLSVAAFQDKWKEDQKRETGYYYALTYPSILSFFKGHPSLSDDLNLKIALVFSWNPTICRLTSIRFEQAKRELAALEPTRKELNARNISNINIDEVIRKLWCPVKMATSLVDSDYGVSVTKFLHFSLPNIFPMVDGKTMKSLGGKTVNLKWYSSLLSEWKNLYE
ncbi:unnamed protein product, partial [marine sediment metagenome]